MIIPITQNMDCARICKVVQNTINRYNKENPNKSTLANHAIVISVVEVTELEVEIPKLENKE